MRVSRALAAGLFLALLLAVPAVRAADDGQEEDPLEHLMETYDEDEGNTLDAAELGALFEAIQSGGAAEEDAHAGHAHHDHDHGHGDHGDEATAEILTVDHILEHYGGHNAVALNESAFLAACPALLRCASEASCEFEHEEESHSSNDGTAHVNLKVGLLFVILVEAPIGGLLPLAFRNFIRAEWIMSICNAFSGGVFLTAGLTHILPHVVESSAEVDHGDYPLPYVLVILGYMLIFLVERVIFHTHGHSLDDHDTHDHSHSHDAHGHSHSHASHKKPPSSANDESSIPLVNGDTHHTIKFLNSMVILLAISLHAVLAGITLGVQGERSNVITIAVAICSHKAPAAFSIGAKFLRDGMPVKLVLPLIGAFSLVTPVGIGIGIGIGSAKPVVRLILEGLAAGTFIYVGATEITTDEFEMMQRSRPNASPARRQDRHRRGRRASHASRARSTGTHGETHRVFRVRCGMSGHHALQPRAARSLREQTSHLLPLVSSRVKDREDTFFHRHALSAGRRGRPLLDPRRPHQRKY